MRERAIQHQADLQKATDQYIKQAAGTSPADELHKLSELKDKGSISQEEYDKVYGKRSEFMKEERTGFVWLYLRK